jgi:hypothetical protein
MGDAQCKAKLAALRQELDTIHFANARYWLQSEPNRDAKVEYQRRLERLERVRKEIAKLERNG